MKRYSQYSDEILLIKLVAGDEKALNEIYMRYWEKLFAISYYHCHNKEMSEEIVQDIFTSLWARRSDVVISNLSAYLATACKFAVYKQILKEKRRKDVLQQHINNNTELSVNEEAKINARFLKDYINGFVEELPTQCKAVFEYSRNSELTTNEIAQQMQISTKTVEGHLTKALKQIRMSLKKLKLFFM